MNPSIDFQTRVEDCIKTWELIVDHNKETDTSVLAFGQCGASPIVLKVIKNKGDEWRSGEILDAFQGHGAVRVYEYTEGAMLLERLNPGESLVSKSISDDEATTVLCQTIAMMSPRAPVNFISSVEDWSKGFERYAASGDDQVPTDLALAAQQLYLDLCRSQKQRRPLHGDLHHSNVLFDANRGWLAIDPKGVVGELEYEVGAALRNPYESPELFTDPSIIRKRVKHFASALNLNSERVLSWAFAQAVLATIWLIEDGFEIQRDHGWIKLAGTLKTMLSELRSTKT